MNQNSNHKKFSGSLPGSQDRTGRFGRPFRRLSLTQSSLHDRLRHQIPQAFPLGRRRHVTRDLRRSKLLLRYRTREFRRHGRLGRRWSFTNRTVFEESSGRKIHKYTHYKLYDSQRRMGRSNLGRSIERTARERRIRRRHRQ